MTLNDKLAHYGCDRCGTLPLFVDIPHPVESAAPDRSNEIAIFICFFLLSLAVYWPVLGIRPLRGDNLYVLAWVNQAPFSALWSLDSRIYPEWRPLAYLTIWLEYRVFRLVGMPFYFLVNLGLWTACAWLVNRIIYELTRYRPAAVLAALWLLFDRRIIEGLSWIVERQTTMACVFGLTVVLLLIRTRDRVLRPHEAAGAAVLLFASGLSKEYGLAFAGAIAIYALIARRYRTLAAAVAAVVLYAGARTTAGPALSTSYCGDMGFLRVVDRHCMDLRAGVGMLQMAWNTTSSFIATLVPGLFDSEGTIGIEYARAARAWGVLAVAAIGWRVGGAAGWLVCLLPFMNGLLSFMLYSERNQIIGVCGIAIALGVGLGWLATRQQRVRGQALMRGLFVAYLLGLLAVRMSDARLVADNMREELNSREPCDSELRRRPWADEFAKQVKRQYGMPDPECRDNDTPFRPS